MIPKTFSQIAAYSFLIFLCANLFPISTFASDGHNKIVGPEECIDCHKRSNEVWVKTPHYTTFKEMSRTEEARDIASKLNINRIKSESTCVQCHYTTKSVENEKKAIAGISCESCHGAGRDYVDIHGDYGGKDVKKENETPEHKKQRIAKSEKAGMIRPANLYALAENCYSCHTVPNEELVNVGGHNTGSKFELVAWSQGMVRHNNWFTPTNDESPLERRRMMYLVGKMVEMEFALRGLANATQKAEYAKAFVFRYKTALDGLKEISALDSNISAINAVIKEAQTAPVKLNEKGTLTQVANKISSIAKSFASQEDGSKFGAIDSLLPAPSAYKGKVHP